MSDLQPRGGTGLSRRERERRAYVLVLATGGLGAAAVLGIVLAAVGVIGFGLPFLAGAAAAVCGLVLRRTLAR